MEYEKCPSLSYFDLTESTIRISILCNEALPGGLAMRIGGIGAPELLIVLLIVLLIFGAGKLPEVFGSLGKGLREFKKSQNEDPEQIAESATDTTKQDNS